MKYNQITTITELRKLLRSGVKAYANVSITSNDDILIQLNKSDFLFQIRNWKDCDLKESRIIYTDILIVG